jgi:hypothetical protein
MLLYADENFPDPAVDELRRLGHDVLTVHQDGLDKASDPAVLSRALKLRRVLLTHNRRHFRRLHICGNKHFGIVSTSHDDNFIDLALRIHRALGGRTPGRWHLMVDKGGVRLE